MLHIYTPYLHSFVLYCCSCSSKYVGEYCQHSNPCHTGARCQNGGSCQVRVSPGTSPSFTCVCPLGFSASLCEIRIANSCDSRPCLNGGTCSLKSLESYQCSCASGYTGKIKTYVGLSQRVYNSLVFISMGNELISLRQIQKFLEMQEIIFLMTHYNACIDVSSTV